MKKEITGVHLMRVAVVLLLSLPLLAASWPDGCTERSNNSEKTLVCKPESWNDDLVVYAHGYVAPQKALELPRDELKLDDGRLVPEILMDMGYAFATTSFSTNGYAVKEGAGNINALTQAFKDTYPDTDHVFVVGGSEGGLIATMLMEKYPEIYDGGLALCGPLGGMPYQIRYLTDFRVLFDYFFQDVFNFGAVEVPEYAYLSWDDYEGAIKKHIEDDPDSTEQLFDVVGVARGSTVDDINASQDILAYNIIGFNDLIDKAGGNPYDNRWRWYRGSDNDWRLNLGVERIRADWRAKRYVKRYYKPTGNLQKPLVTLHTTRDPIVPYRHELLYSLRTLAKGNGNNLVALPAFAYGHCNFKAAQVVGSFGILIWMSTGELPFGFETYLESMQ